MRKFSKKQKVIGIISGLSAVGLTGALITVGYIYTKSWTPFKNLLTKGSPEKTSLNVKIESKIPVYAQVEYGTSPEYTNRTALTEDMSESHSIQVAHILPDREHYVRIIAKTRDGKEFKSDFLKVE